MSEYSEWMAEYQDLIYLQEKAHAGHWANDLLDKPHALISVIETKISRAAIAERERIIKLLKENTVICNGHWSHNCLDIANCPDYDPKSRQRNWHGKGPCEEHFMGGNCNDVIALIKGEQK